MDDNQLIDLTGEIVSAFVGNNKVAADALPGLIQSVHSALGGVGGPTAAPGAEERRLTPAQIRKSITPDALISFIDGGRYKMLKRHLTTQGVTVAEYKARFGLPADYPTTAPNYSAARSEWAKASGLGQGAGRRPARATSVARRS